MIQGISFITFLCAADPSQVLNPTPQNNSSTSTIVFVKVDSKGIGVVGKVVIGVCVPCVLIAACCVFVMMMKKRDTPNKTQDIVTKKEVEEDPDTE